MSNFPAGQMNIQQAFEMLRRNNDSLFKWVLDIRRKVDAWDVRDKLAAVGRTPRMPLVFRSQFGEDLMLWDLLGPQLDGFYIECGAFDGLDYSVSYIFDAMGWNGLLVEAIPERAEQCKANRPNARVVHSALARRDSPKEITFTVTEDHHGGMLSHINMPATFAVPAAMDKVKMRKVTVPCSTMNELLKDHKGPIDVAVIDVEGGEVDLLDGFDLMKYMPRLLVLEDNDPSNPALTKYMAKMPYTMLSYSHANRVYLSKAETEIMKRLQRG
jgi:FkbM family methyltransferase